VARKTAGTSTKRTPRAPGKRTSRGRTKDTWRPADKRRARAIRDRLRAFYGRPRNEPHHAPLDELVLTVLSQNTNDRNRDVAYSRLRARFPQSGKPSSPAASPDWKAVAEAPVEEVEEAIRPGGISRVKSRRIQAMLGAIETENMGKNIGKAGSLDLEPLASAPREEAIELLERLPGVGRKTAACVLLFSFDRPELPVDTHVYRVTSRLGLIRPKASFEEAHDTLLRLTDPADVYELHVNLIRHGRRICTARTPRCTECPLLSLCPYGRERVRKT
jgi:endonuclease III